MAFLRRAVFAPAAVGAIVLVGLAGCGGSSSDGGADGGSADDVPVRDLATKVKTFTAKRDAKGLCGLFEPERMKAWVGKDCVKIFKLALREVPAPEQLKIEDISREGDKATVKYAYGDVQVSKIDGTWYLDTPEPRAPDPDSSSE